MDLGMGNTHHGFLLRCRTEARNKVRGFAFSSLSAHAHFVRAGQALSGPVVCASSAVVASFLFLHLHRFYALGQVMSLIVAALSHCFAVHCHFWQAYAHSLIG
jgi:LPS sulfotransferase NodH